MYQNFLSFLFILWITPPALCQSPQSAATGITVPKSQPSDASIEIEAEFPGGVAAWTAYLQKNLKARVPIKHKAPNGRYTVIVKFAVCGDGSISDVQPETHHGYGMEGELIRIIKKGPKWIPATRNGKPIIAYRRQPITFLVTG